MNKLIAKDIANININIIKYFNFKNIVELISLFLNQNIPPLSAAKMLYNPEEKYACSFVVDKTIIVININTVWVIKLFMIRVLIEIFLA